MKIHVLSDLHLEFQPFDLSAIDADLVVLAGDIHIRERGVTWAIDKIKNIPVLYVLGNHEYYGSAYPKLINKLKDIAANTNVTILERDFLTIDDVTFFGCTLWTNFELFGHAPYAGYEATQKISDFRKIRISPQYSKFRAIDASIIHRKSLTWLQDSLLTNKSQKSVVITHHAPSKKSIPDCYQEDILSAAYASNLDNFIANSPVDLWVHGHTHHQWDYQIGNTRIICNSRGYPDELNYDFNPNLVVEI